MTETLGLMLRVGLSFTFVLGLMWFAARLLRGKMGSGGAGVLEVLARQQVGRGASIAIVRVADRAMVIGVTEHGVNMLGEPIADLASVTTTAEAATPSPEAIVGRPGDQRHAAINSPNLAAGGSVDTTGASPLRGSVLSPSTWRQAVNVLRERTVRR